MDRRLDGHAKVSKVSKLSSHMASSYLNEMQVKETEIKWERERRDMKARQD